IIFYDDLALSPEHDRAEMIVGLREMLKANRNARFQQEVAMHVMKYELADMQPGKQPYNEKSADIRKIQEAMNIQDVKAAFAEARIRQLLYGEAHTDSAGPDASAEAKEEAAD